VDPITLYSCTREEASSIFQLKVVVSLLCFQKKRSIFRGVRIRGSADGRPTVSLSDEKEVVPGLTRNRSPIVSFSDQKPAAVVEMNHGMIDSLIPPSPKQEWYEPGTALRYNVGTPLNCLLGW
jgi:hypothetical protein